MISPTLRWTLILVGSACYLGLAIIGRGGPGAFFAVDALIALLVVQVPLTVAAMLAGGNLSTGVKEDRTNRWVIPAFGVIGLLQAYLPAWTDRREILCLDGDSIRWIGVILVALGGGLRLWPVYVLGNRFSGLVAIQPDHALATDGIYRLIRHPSYLGLIMNMLGWGLAFRSGVGVMLTIALLLPLSFRIAAEERLLKSAFGAEYDLYRARTPLLLPRLRRPG